MILSGRLVSEPKLPRTFVSPCSTCQVAMAPSHICWMYLRKASRGQNHDKTLFLMVNPCQKHLSYLIVGILQQNHAKNPCQNPSFSWIFLLFFTSNPWQLRLKRPARHKALLEASNADASEFPRLPLLLTKKWRTHRKNGDPTNKHLGFSICSKPSFFLIKISPQLVIWPEQKKTEFHQKI